MVFQYPRDADAPIAGPASCQPFFEHMSSEKIRGEIRDSRLFIESLSDPSFFWQDARKAAGETVWNVLLSDKHYGRMEIKMAVPTKKPGMPVPWIVLRPNLPLETHPLAEMIDDPSDLFMVWPAARQPFDHDQWREALNTDQGNRSYWVYQEDRRIGHGALRPVSADTYSINFLYLRPESRGMGLGRALMLSLESIARDELSAMRLTLKVRSYNRVAVACYSGCGYREDWTEGTLICMAKDLTPEHITGRSWE